MLIYVHENLSVTFLFLMGGKVQYSYIKEKLKVKIVYYPFYLHKVCISKGILHFRLIGMSVLLLVL